MSSKTCCICYEDGLKGSSCTCAEGFVCKDCRLEMMEHGLYNCPVCNAENRFVMPLVKVHPEQSVQRTRLRRWYNIFEATIVFIFVELVCVATGWVFLNLMMGRRDASMLSYIIAGNIIICLSYGFCVCLACVKQG